ncbi:MAG: type II toxin-antitoxin system HicB family antitoxin [Nitrospirae bacterium]|nr:type II toxin-antitoxin system HicB family antitoxin [Nitrospirota bacterium]
MRNKEPKGRKTRAFPVIIERDANGYYVGIIPDLNGCHTQAPSFMALESRLKDVIALCLRMEGRKSPRSRFVGVHMIEVKA